MRKIVNWSHETSDIQQTKLSEQPHFASEIDKSQHFNFLEKLWRQIGIKQPQDWCSVKNSTIRQLGGTKLLEYYGGHLVLALIDHYPQYPWHAWKFSTKVPKHYWDEIQHRKQYFEWLANKLGIQLQDLQKIDPIKINQTNGGSLLEYYKGSLITALFKTFPEHSWEAWKFKEISVPPLFWNPINVRNFLEKLGAELHIEHLNEWHGIPQRVIAKRGGSFLLSKFGGKIGLLEVAYPDHNWKDFPTNQTRWMFQKTQNYLFKLLLGLFPDQEMSMNFQHETLTFKSGQRIELDIFIPKLFLAFEYQGHQHFSHYLPAHNVRNQLQRDEEKRRLCKENGIVLIEIPYWWDLSKESLLATIQKTAPTLFQSNEELKTT